ncbi:MAG: hypothetical protein WAP51_00875 [Candidatus Sungiibacteriota bacterium]
MEGKYPPSGGWPKLIPSSREEFERWDRQLKEHTKESRRERESKERFRARLGIALIVLGVAGLLIFALALSL